MLSEQKHIIPGELKAETREGSAVVTFSLTHLSGFLGSFGPHHVLSDELLEELHLGNAEVEIQTAGHVHLQGVATHHHLLETRGR